MCGKLNKVVLSEVLFQVILLFILISSSERSYGQSGELIEEDKQKRFVTANNIKAQKIFLIKQNFAKLKEPRIMREVYFNTQGRVVKNIVFRQSTDVSYIEEFDYDEYGNISLYKKQLGDSLYKRRSSDGFSYTVLNYENFAYIEELDYDKYGNISLYKKPLDDTLLKKHVVNGPVSYLKIGYLYDSLGYIQQLKFYKGDIVERIASLGKNKVINPLAAKLIHLYIYPNLVLDAHVIKGNIHNIKELNKAGRIVKEQRVVIDNEQRVGQVVSVDNKMKTVAITKYKYNQKGYVTEQEFLDRKGKLVEKMNFEYNDHSLLDKIIVIDKKNKTKQVLKYAYEYYQ